jgi:hypothetical protein
MFIKIPACRKTQEVMLTMPLILVHRGIAYRLEVPTKPREVIGQNRRQQQCILI